MRTTLQQLEDLKEWSQDSTRYERRLNFRGGQLVQPGQPGVRQGYEGPTNWKPLGKRYQNKIKKVFGDADFSKGRYGFKRGDPGFWKAYEFAERGYIEAQPKGAHFGKQGVIPKDVQRDIKSRFHTVEESKWKFWDGKKGFRFGINSTTDQALAKRIERYINEPVKNLYLFDHSSPEGWMLQQMDRAYKQGMTLPDGSPAYKRILNKNGKIVGMQDFTEYGKGKRYFASTKWLDKNGVLIQDLKNGHVDYENTKHFIKIIDKAKLKPSKVITDLLVEGGIKVDERLTLNHLLNYLIDAQGAEKTKRALVPHHRGGLGRATGDLQLVNKLVNNKARGIEKKMRLNPKNINAENIQKLKDLNIRVIVDGKSYGKGPLLPETAFKAQEKLILEGGDIAGKKITGIKDWTKGDFKKFKKFKIHVDKQLPNIIKGYQKAKIGGHCKAYGGRVGFEEAGAVNMSKCMTKAIEDNKKAMNSTDESVRAAAIFKNRQAVNNAKKIPAIAKLIRQGIQKGKSSVGWLLGGWNIPLEAIVEGGIYEYYRREGYTHDQAFAETFTPRLIKEGAEARSTEKVPWYGGAEELLEEELYKIKGENEFLDVDNRPPMQDPEFGQVIGEREGVKRYIDNMAALDEVTSEYYKTQDHLTAIQSGRKAVDPETVERLQIRLKELEAEGIRLNRLIKEGSSDWQLHQTQLEKQQTEQGQRAIEYGEYGQGDTEALAKRREKIRQREMEDKFPGYGKAQMDQRLEDWGYYMDPNLRYKGKTVQNPQGLNFLKGWNYDDFSDYLVDQDKMNYFAENFRTEKAGGGIAGIRRPWAIPPESGPMPQGGGLSSQYNRVKKLTE